MRLSALWDLTGAHEELLPFIHATTPDYLAGWVHEELCQVLERFARDLVEGRRPRLIITLPPRHGKSTMAERFSVWHLGRYPRTEVVYASYALVPARNRARAARAVAAGEDAGGIFPGLTLAPDQRAKTDWRVSAGGGVLAVGVGGALTGAGADLLIVDDPHKSWAEAYSPTRREAVWEWFTSVALTRLSPRSGMLVIATRWHEDDLIGRLLDREGERWEVYCRPAIAVEDEEHRARGEALHPARFPLDHLDEIKETLGSRQWLALYQGGPTTPGGSVWRREWWKHWTHQRPTPVEASAGWRRCPEKWDRLILSWDLTFGSKTARASNVVGLVIAEAGGDWFVLEEVTGKWGFAESCKQISAQLARYPEALAVLVEKAANGAAVIETLQAIISRIKAVRPKGSKLARAHAVSVHIERGRVYLPAPAHAPWVGPFLDEVSAFPEGRKDDKVDALSQGLRLLAKSRSPVGPPRKPATPDEKPAAPARKPETRPRRRRRR